jgi:hypothetical protein
MVGVWRGMVRMEYSLFKPNFKNFLITVPLAVELLIQWTITCPYTFADFCPKKVFLQGFLHIQYIIINIDGRISEARSTKAHYCIHIYLLLKV